MNDDNDNGINGIVNGRIVLMLVFKVTMNFDRHDDNYTITNHNGNDNSIGHSISNSGNNNSGNMDDHYVNNNDDSNDSDNDNVNDDFYHDINNINVD